MGNMHQDLNNFKQEIEQDLLTIKNEWINSTLQTFVDVSPIPERAPFSQGPFINTIILRYNKKSERFDYAKKKQIAYIITDPYSKISITSFIYYNENIETLGWGENTPPYRPFLKTFRKSFRLLDNLCNIANLKSNRKFKFKVKRRR